MEKINRIEILDSGELFLGIEGDGMPMYQYVYREGAGVYRDPDRKGFKSTELRGWTSPQWFAHILEITERVGIDLILCEEISWRNVSEEDKILILAGGVSDRPSRRIDRGKKIP